MPKKPASEPLSDEVLQRNLDALPEAHRFVLDEVCTREDGRRFTFLGYVGEQADLTSWRCCETGARWHCHVLDSWKRMWPGSWNPRSVGVEDFGALLTSVAEGGAA